jgi:hypothetical protein
MSRLAEVTRRPDAARAAIAIRIAIIPIHREVRAG